MCYWYMWQWHEILRAAYKKHSNVDGDIIMHKLTKDGAVKAAWTSAIMKGRKQIGNSRKSS